MFALSPIIAATSVYIETTLWEIRENFEDRLTKKLLASRKVFRALQQIY